MDPRRRPRADGEGTDGWPRPHLLLAGGTFAAGLALAGGPLWARLGGAGLALVLGGLGLRARASAAAAEGAALAETGKAEERAEEARAAALDRALDFMEAGRERPVFILDPQKDHLSWSPGLGRLLGYAGPELRPDVAWWMEHLHPDDQGAVAEGLEAVLGPQGAGAPDTWTVSYRLRRRDGSYLALRSRAMVVRDGEGRVRRLLGRLDLLEPDWEAPTPHLVKEILDGVAWMDPEGSYRTLNPAARKLLGLDDDGEGPFPMAELHPEWAQHRLQEEVLPKVLAGATWEGDSCLLHRDGRELPVSLRLSPEAGPGGQVVRILAVWRDDSDAVWREEAVREREAHLRQLASLTLEGIALHDRGTILDCNDTLPRLFGYAPVELLGRSLAELVPPDQGALVERYLDLGREDTLELTGLRQDGSSFPLEMELRTVSSGGVPLRVATLRDVSRRQRAERQLERTLSALENAVEGIGSADEYGRFTHLNRAYAAMLGYEPRDFLGLDWTLAVHPEDRAALMDAYVRMVRGGKAAAEVRGLRRDGADFDQELTLVAAYGDQGQLLGHHVFVRDISARKRGERALQEAEARWRLILEACGNGILGEDADGHCTFVNRAASEALGYAPSELLGRSMHELIHHSRPDGSPYPPESCPLHEAAVEGRAVRGLQEQVWTKEGQPLPVEVSSLPIQDPQGRLRGTVTAFSDIRDRLRTEAALRTSEERLTLAIEGSNDGLIDFNVETREVYYSPRWKGMLGYRDAEVGASPEELLSRLHPEDLKGAMERWTAHLKGELPNFEMELRMRHKDGGYRWMLCRGKAMRSEGGRAVRVVGSQTDITPLKALEERLRREATRDELTDLYNRRYFMERLSPAIQSARRHGHPLSLCLCDLDHFKKVNDTYGHRAGDEVLATFSTVVQQALRGEDIPARFGGDEFCILFSHIPATQAVVCLERIRAQMERQFFQDNLGNTFHITATFGLADLTEHATEPAELLELADQALYRAKERGRNRVEVFLPA